MVEQSHFLPALTMLVPHGCLPFSRGCGENVGDSVLAGQSSKAKMKEMCTCCDGYCSGLIQLEFPNPAL